MQPETPNIIYILRLSKNKRYDKCRGMAALSKTPTESKSQGVTNYNILPSGAFVYIFFGTSKDVTVGPTSIMSSLVASLANGDVVYAICLSLVAGCYMLLFGES